MQKNLEVSKKFKKLLISGMIVLLFIMTYGRWEYLSWKHSKEFLQPILVGIQEGCFLDEPKKVKVMSYSKQKAKVFMKSVNNSTYVIRFKRIKDTQDWILKYDGGTCNYHILNSTTGGSADQWLYWYF